LVVSGQCHLETTAQHPCRGKDKRPPFKYQRVKVAFAKRAEQGAGKVTIEAEATEPTRPS
jgi:hypothetical protein